MIASWWEGGGYSWSGLACWKDVALCRKESGYTGLSSPWALPSGLENPVFSSSFQYSLTLYTVRPGQAGVVARATETSPAVLSDPDLTRKFRNFVGEPVTRCSATPVHLSTSKPLHQFTCYHYTPIQLCLVTARTLEMLLLLIHVF